jgi:phosphoglycerate-specific signal transduction histidine kinase
LYRATCQLKTYAFGLEEQVQDRTAELRDRQRRESEIAQARLDELSQQLVQTTRLATIGQTMASIAHEVLNPLSAVRNAAFLLKRKLSASDPSQNEYLDLIDKEVQQANRVIRDMVAMARAKAPVKTSFDVSAVVRDVFDQMDKKTTVRPDASSHRKSSYQLNSSDGRQWRSSRGTACGSRA